MEDESSELGVVVHTRDRIHSVTDGGAANRSLSQELLLIFKLTLDYFTQIDMVFI